MKIQAVLAVWITTPDVMQLTQAAIENYKSLGLELIIVDNASTMGEGYLKENADIYIRNQKNLGYAPAMNQGLKLSTSKYIVFAENDVLVSPETIGVGKEILDNYGDVGSVHYRMVPYQEDFSFGNETYLTGKERWCTFSFFMVRRVAVPYGLLDENYIMANYEDWDFIHRMRHILGWKTAYTNKACYKHFDSYTQKKLDQNDRAVQGKANREYFKNKFGAYPEDIWNAIYSDQMNQNWRPFP